MPDQNQTKDEGVLTALEPAQIERLAERLNWRHDGTSLRKQFSFSSRDEAFEFLTWVVKRVARTTLDLNLLHQGGGIELILTSSGQGFTTNDLRFARQVNAKASPRSP